ncbi:hypothetical protein Scep_026852 [Stephania cephalantha]|uniref:Uncharacterized protein n=1 Tax=Stephania cephalantha TaxID=152367 RepID=A0AAP0HNJ4_9MAGN
MLMRRTTNSIQESQETFPSISLTIPSNHTPSNTPIRFTQFPICPSRHFPNRHTNESPPPFSSPHIRCSVLPSLKDICKLVLIGVFCISMLMFV